MRADCTVFPKNASPAGQQDTNSSMTLFGEHSSELTFLLPRSLPVLFERPDGLTLVPCQGGRCLTWAAIVDTLAFSYVQIGSTASVGSVNAAAARKHAKYDTISATHIFVPVAVETLEPFCDEGLKFISKIGLRLSTIFDDSRELNFLFQRISVLIQRFNEVAFVGPFKTYQTPKANDSSPCF